jgi:hypothetical protein
MLRALVRLALLLSLAAAVLWFALPAAAAGLAAAAVSATGLEGEDLEVTVIAHPPFKLLLLEADAVRVRAGRSTWRGATMERVDVTVTGLRLGSPPEGVEGRLDGVAFPGRSGEPLRASSVLLAGPASAPEVSVELEPAELAALLDRALRAELGRVVTVIPVPPDGVRITIAGAEFAARLEVTAEGGLVLVVGGSPISLRVTVLRPGEASPLVPRSVAVEVGRLVVHGTVDAALLGL